MIQKVNEIVETARTCNIREAEERLKGLLRQYPANISLKYHAVGAISMFEIFYPMSSSEKKEEWKGQRRELLQSVYMAGASPYRQGAVSVLASMALAEDDTDRAEKLLKELPQNSGDPTMLWALLYQKRNDVEKALEVTQKRLYSLVRQVQSCLALLMSEEMEPDTERALEICDIYQKVEQLFNSGDGMSSAFLAELYMKAGKKEKALESICHLVDVFTNPVQLPSPLLFSKAFQPKEGQKYPQEMRKMILSRMLEDEEFKEFRGNEAFQRAAERLRGSMQNQTKGEGLLRSI